MDSIAGTTAVMEAERLRAENERLRARLEEARTLILAASVHMPTWPHAKARNNWIQDQQNWLNGIQG